MARRHRLVACIVLAGACLWPGTAAPGAQATETQIVMREKLATSERLLAAVVTSDWTALDRNGRELVQVTMKPGWIALRLPEFSRYSAGFARAAQQVVDAAATRDQRTAVQAYTSLVTSCVECHRYVARARQARVPEPSREQASPPERIKTSAGR